MESCEHLEEIRDVTPSANGCEDCLKIGGQWLHLRLCEICGHVGCCDNLSEPSRDEALSFDESSIIKSFEPARLGLLYPDDLFYETLPEPK
jgi:hypothetical protein